jgi:putative tryptophan/tyrosine transport system substrate-binding protein
VRLPDVAGGMDRRRFLASTLATALLPRITAAQPPQRVARVGWLSAQQAASLAPSLDALRAGLATYGYQEGRNLVIEYRYADDVYERVPELADELIRLPVDLLVAQGAALYEIANRAWPVPIVYIISADPVSSGFASSLARPLGNMTGLTLMAVEFNGKRLELLREILPTLRRLSVIGNPEHPGAHLERAFSEETGRHLGVAITYVPTRTREELTTALNAMGADPPQAISILADGFAVQNRQLIIDFAMKHHVPTISGWPVFAQSGALCTYGPLLSESYRRLAYYIDRVLRGAKPADLPIERPSQFELVINLKIAKALGLTIPPAVLARADRVIE